jgi:hypothetical protein
MLPGMLRFAPFDADRDVDDDRAEHTMAHLHEQPSTSDLPGFKTASVLLDAGLSADIVRRWLCEDFGLSAVESLVAVEAALREQLQALFETSGS